MCADHGSKVVNFSFDRNIRFAVRQSHALKFKSSIGLRRSLGLAAKERKERKKENEIFVVLSVRTFFEHVLECNMLVFKVVGSTRFGTRFGTRLPGYSELPSRFDQECPHCLRVRGEPVEPLGIPLHQIRGAFLFIRVHSRFSYSLLVAATLR